MDILPFLWDLVVSRKRYKVTLSTSQKQSAETKAKIKTKTSMELENYPAREIVRSLLKGNTLWITFTRMRNPKQWRSSCVYECVEISCTPVDKLVCWMRINKKCKYSVLLGNSTWKLLIPGRIQSLAKYEKYISRIKHFIYCLTMNILTSELIRKMWIILQ